MLPLIGIVAGILAWLLSPTRLDDRIVDRGPLIRSVRRVRAIWVRAVLAFLSWPHLVEIAAGTRRAKGSETPSDVVWSEGRARLYRFRPTAAKKHDEPILLVHALITRPWILDLTPSRSMVRFLLDQGFEVLLLDWGDPTADDAHRGLSDYAVTLLAAEQEALASTNASRLHLLGYCTGATLCLARLGAWPHEWIASFVALAPPVDLSAASRMSRLLTHRLLKPALLLDGEGCVPGALLRESFHLLRFEALKAIGRVMRARRDPDAFASYSALSRWIFEQRRLGGALLVDLLRLYRSNALWDGTLDVAGRRSDLSAIRCPTLVAIASRDHIVPPDSSRALSSLSGVETLMCPSGHVSMIGGPGGMKVLWPALVAWFSRDRTEPKPRRGRASRPRATGSSASR